MKILKLIMTIFAAALVLVASEGAWAAHVGVYIGVPIGIPAYPYPYYAPYYYPPPVTVVPAAPPSYVVQQPATVESPAPSQYWYYCPDSKAYYPYVKQCASNWQQVAPQPSPGP